MITQHRGMNMLTWPDLKLPPINLWSVPKQIMTIQKVTVIKGKPYPRDKEVINFFEEKGLYEKTTYSDQFLKLKEEVGELEEALPTGDDEQILSEAGDVYITLLNVLKCCGLTMEQAVNYSVDKVVKRKGKVENGVFIKDGD